MSNENITNNDIFECKMYITDLETNKNSKEINVSDLVFNDWIEFEFGNYEDDDYGTLPYKDFKFFINDYSVTFYSPQYHKAVNEIERLNNIINELEQWLKELIDSFDENVSEPIMHEQCTIKYVYDYLQYLKENKQ